MKNKNNLPQIFPALLLFIGFLYRIYGLEANHSFWTDENHLALFVRAIFERGKPVLANGYATGVYQWLAYWLSTASARFFGFNEFAIRFPSVIFGTLTIWAVYLLGKEIFSQEAGLAAAALTTFLKIEILHSRQARPYQGLQFLYLLAAFFLYRLVQEKKLNPKNLLGFFLTGIAAFLMHGLGLVVFLHGFLIIFFLWPNWLKAKWLLFGLLGILILALPFRSQLAYFAGRLGQVNNLFYYRVFLTHNYLPLILLAGLGFLSQVFQKRKNSLILASFLAVQLIFVSFFQAQPFTRYFYLVFPFFILYAAQFMALVSQKIARPKFLSLLLLFLFVFSLIVLSPKYTLFPQKVYSLNEDMQESPEVDWKKIYSFIAQKLADHPQAVLITNWNDLPVWYLGEGSLDYLIRKKVSVKVDALSSAPFLFSLDELKEIIDQKPAGILVLDSWDNWIPEGVSDYARDYLQKELEVDRLYPVQPRYWPVNVYSWGLK